MSTAHTVPVTLGERSYDVAVGCGLRRDLAAVLEALPDGPPGAAAVVTQKTLVDQPWFGDIETGVPGPRLVVGPSEEEKSLGSVEYLCRSMAAAGISRRDVVVAVGGGLVSDLAGFAAAVYARGITLVNVPTTLLGQVDAAIGGKTGANLPEGKNLVGAFWQPAAVLCDTETLASLPPREVANGRGELAKYALLGSIAPGCPPALPGTAILDLPLEDQVAHCVAVKAAVVAVDEREGGGRALLNYGHTLGHALEAAAFDPSADGGPDGTAGGDTAAAWDLRHGEAVAIGLVFAAELAQRMGRIGPEMVERHRQVVQGFGLSSELPDGARAPVLVALMGRDKKAVHDLTFVLDGPSGIELVRGVAADVVTDTLVAMGAKP